jgi:putative NADH-flavin reductase
VRIVVFGATGGTGRELVRQGAAAGNSVVAIGRHPQSLAITANVEVLAADVTDLTAITPAIRGADAVLSALGTRAMNEPTTVYSAGTTNILAAMQIAGVRRFIAVSAAPVGPSKNVLERAILFPILYRFFGQAYDDMKRMETLLAASDCDWTVFRPPQLVDRAPKGTYRTAIDSPLSGAFRITRADLAAAMLASINDPTVFRRSIAIAN